MNGIVVIDDQAKAHAKDGVGILHARKVEHRPLAPDRAVLGRPGRPGVPDAEDGGLVSQIPSRAPPHTGPVLLAEVVIRLHFQLGLVADADA